MLGIRQKPIDPCKVAIYIRWSTEDQGEGTTLGVQLEGCRHYAISQEWTVSDALTFIDDGYSGGSLNRPALTRLREAVQRGAVDCVVVYKLDRLSRDVPDMIRLIMDEWEERCFVKSAREPIDTTSQSGKMFFYTLASYAEWERSVIKERTFSGKLRRAQEGRNPGQTAPYGYRLGEPKGTFAVIEHEAELVRRIFALYRQGHGASKIAAAFNAEGLTFREGRLWSASTIKHILRNAVYKGDLVFGKRVVVGKRQARRMNPSPHVVREGVLPAIVSREEWQQVQQIRQSRPGPHQRTSGRSHSSAHLLTGLLRCGGCGTAMRAVGASYGEVRYNYYVCETVNDKGRSGCQARRIRRELLDDLVAAKLLQLYGTGLTRAAFLDRAMGELAAREQAARAALEEAEAMLARHEAKRRKLRSLVLEGALTTGEYRAFVQDVEEEARELEERRRQLAQQVGALGVARSEQVGLARSMERLDAWESLSRPEQKELLRTFLGRVEAFMPHGSSEVQVRFTWWVPGGDGEHTVTVKDPGGRGRYPRARG